MPLRPAGAVSFTVSCFWQTERNLFPRNVLLVRINSCRASKSLSAFVTDSVPFQPKMMSAAMPVYHGDTVQFGGTTLELHIHPGNETCDGCEPGNVQAEMKKQQTETSKFLFKRRKIRRKTYPSMLWTRFLHFLGTDV